MSVGEIVMWVGAGMAILLSIVQGAIFWQDQDWGAVDSSPLNLLIKICVVAFFAGYGLNVFGI